MHKFLITSAVALMAVTGHAMAQESTVTGAVGGAATGAILGGPVGAAVGGVAGAIAGTAIDPPPQEVVTYVEEQPEPTTEPVIIDRQVVVGEPLPPEIVIVPIPDHDQYAYTVVNQRRVIVDPQTHTVIDVLE